MSVKLDVDTNGTTSKDISESLMLAGGDFMLSYESNGSDPRLKAVCESNNPMLNHTLRRTSASKAEAAGTLSEPRPHASAIRTASASKVQVIAALTEQRIPAYVDISRTLPSVGRRGRLVER